MLDSSMYTLRDSQFSETAIRPLFGHAACWQIYTTNVVLDRHKVRPTVTIKSMFGLQELISRPNMPLSLGWSLKHR